MNVVFAVCDMAKVWFRVPKWLRFRGFARWILAVANRVRRVGSGFNRAFHLENGCSDCKNGVFVFRFLYFSGLVRRNSFVNVVVAVCEFCEMIVVIRLFAWLKGVKLVVECWVLWLESGVFEVGLFGFRLKKKEGRLTTFPC